MRGIDNQWDSQIWEIINFNLGLWQTALKVNDTPAAQQTVETIKNIGINSAKNKLKHSTPYSLVALINIFQESKEDSNSFMDSIDAIGEIAAVSAENNINSAELQALDSIDLIIDKKPNWLLVKPLLKMGIFL